MATDTSTITFTPTLRSQLRVAYDMAVLDGKEVFCFEGHPIVTSYAKYLLEYLDTKFPLPAAGHAQERRL